jgi:hypothetical protein
MPACQFTYLVLRKNSGIFFFFLILTLSRMNRAWMKKIENLAISSSLDPNLNVKIFLEKK